MQRKEVLKTQRESASEEKNVILRPEEKCI